jgi:hypothetical protein
MGTHRVLIAAQPGAWRMLQTMLGDVADVIPAHTTAEAFKILDRGRIDLIIATIAFDESQMMDFLVAVKGTNSTAGIPFLCSRVLRGVIRDSVVGAMRDTCKECGAADLIDIANLPPDTGKHVMRAAVMSCLQPTKPD